jgi:hypothetical protein
VELEHSAAKAVEAALAYQTNGHSAAEAAALLQRFKDEAIKNTGATGANAVAIGRLADELFRIPENVSSTVTVTTIKRTIVEESIVQHRSRAGGPAEEAEGGILSFAVGGLFEKHVAQIVRAGTVRVWGEKETGGEAYIPLSPQKRPRSLAILSEVAHRFGFGLLAESKADGAAVWSGGAAQGNGIERRLDVLIATMATLVGAVGRVAPGVGAEINGANATAFQLARARG